jgi:hypothetical protein
MPSLLRAGGSALLRGGSKELKGDDKLTQQQQLDGSIFARCVSFCSCIHLFKAIVQLHTLRQLCVALLVPS